MKEVLPKAYTYNPPPAKLVKKRFQYNDWLDIKLKNCFISNLVFHLRSKTIVTNLRMILRKID